MNKYFFLMLFILIPNILLAEVRITLSFPKAQIKQGQLEEAEITMDFSAAQNFEIQKLKDTTPGDILYFHKISPMMRSNAGGTLTGKASVVFINVPQTNFVRFNEQDETIHLSWNDIEITPTEAKPVFLYENFSIPGRKEIKSLFIPLILIFLLLPLGVFLFRRYKKDKAEKERKRQLKESLLGASKYEEVVELWKEKNRFITEFPASEQAFRNLEEVLFKYQFKPTQDISEKNEVMKAYRDFTNRLQENLNGI